MMHRRESGRPRMRMRRRESGRPKMRMRRRESGRPSATLSMGASAASAASPPSIPVIVHNVQTLSKDGIEVGAFGTTLTARHQKRGEDRQCVIALTTPYVEVQLLAVPAGGVVAVGLAQSDAKITFREMPGWIAGTVGVHSDDGGMFVDSGTKALCFLPKFTVGDVVGIGFTGGFLTVYINRKLVFRKVWLCKDRIPRGLVGMDMPGTIVAVNPKANLPVDKTAPEKKL